MDKDVGFKKLIIKTVFFINKRKGGRVGEGDRKKEKQYKTGALSL